MPPTVFPGSSVTYRLTERDRAVHKTDVVSVRALVCSLWSRTRIGLCFTLDGVTTENHCSDYDATGKALGSWS